MESITARIMARKVQICVPEAALDDPRWGDVADFDQRTGWLANNSSTIVNIDGVEIQFPAGWIKPAIHND